MIKVLFFMFALIVAYLFALNGRYIKIEDDKFCKLPKLAY